MPQLRVKFVNEAKPGKKYGSIVAQDNTRYPCPAALVSKFQKGQTVEVETKSETWGDSEVQVIKAIKGGGSGNGAVAANGDKWWLPFVSNTVAHAIAAGKIEEPSQIKQWAAAAKQSAEEVASGKRALPGGFEEMPDDPDF